MEYASAIARRQEMGDRRARWDSDQQVTGDTEDRECQDADEHNGGVAERSRIIHHVAQTCRRGDHLRDHYRSPRGAHRQAQAGEQMRQAAGDEDPPEEIEVGKLQHTADLNQFGVDGAEALVGGDVDREEDALGNQQDLGSLADAEPEGEVLSLPCDKNNISCIV